MKDSTTKKITENDIKEANRSGLIHKDLHDSGDVSKWWSYHTPVLQIAYNLGLDGIDLANAPVVRGWRYGAIPQSGLSHNYADDRCENGLSLAALDDKEVTPSAMFFTDRKKFSVEGVLLPKTGSDGEPLILPFVENWD